MQIVLSACTVNVRCSTVQATQAISQRVITTVRDKPFSRSLKNSPTVYLVRFHQIERELTMLEPLLLQQASAQAYRYQLSPGEYVKKEQPKKALILVLGAMLGMMAGIGWVLVSDSLARYRHGASAAAIPPMT